jgi:hypothetical protein
MRVAWGCVAVALVTTAAAPGCRSILGFEDPTAYVDAGSPDPDEPDARPVWCYGSDEGLVKPCFAEEPRGELELPPMIDSDASPLCTATVSGGEGLCVIAAAAIDAGGVVRATGSRPVVLVATSSIAIHATLDAASHRSPSPPFRSVSVGAGASDDGCDPGIAPGASGGGAGGSFAGAGGNGGDGAGVGDSRGRPGATMAAVTALRGGCSGQGGASGTPGQGGHGGGAIYLIAVTEIAIAGSLNASGEGGHPGLANAAGGGGGGSGGMIGLDAPRIVNNGVVFANGASGGEGSGSTTAGAPGPEPSGAAGSPPPLSATATGGDGGRGSADGLADGGAAPAGSSGGGGGGGGIGVIRVWGAVLGDGAFSPQPS